MGKTQFIITTDGQHGRGVNIPDLKYVVIFDIPSDLSTYLQWAGRCARGDVIGTCFSVTTGRDVAKFVKFQ